MSHANCSTHRFCAEFLHGSCNITFIRLPTLEKQKFENGVCCTTYKVVQRVKAMTDTILKQKCVSRNSSVFLKGSKMQLRDEDICISRHEERASTP